MLGIDVIDDVSYEEWFKNLKYFWEDRLKDYFPFNYIDNLTDFNYSTCFTYLLTINEQNKLGLHNMDNLIAQEDQYFIEIIISIKKPIASVHFFKYIKESKGQILVSTDRYFEENQKDMYRKCVEFAQENNLLLLSDDHLSTIIKENNDSMSIYYKYFNQESEDKTKIPYSL